MATSKMLSNFRFHIQRANGRVVQDLGEALPDDSRDMTDAGAIGTSSSARACVPVLAGGVHGVILDELLHLVLEGTHARVHVAWSGRWM